MNIKYAAPLGGHDGTHIAIAQVVELLGTVYVHVRFSAVKTRNYILLDSFGNVVDLSEDIRDGDHILVRFYEDDRYARIVPMDELAERLTDQMT